MLKNKVVLLAVRVEASRWGVKEGLGKATKALPVDHPSLKTTTKKRSDMKELQQLKVIPRSGEESPR